jgi:hypothetical protein
MEEQDLGENGSFRHLVFLRGESCRVGCIGLSPAKGIAATLGVALSELAKAAERLEG